MFTDLGFILRFLPILFALYFLSVSFASRVGRGRRNFGGANMVLLAGSIVFYADAAGTFTWLIITAVVLNYGTAHAIARALRLNAGQPDAPVAATTRPRGPAGPVPEALLTFGVWGNVMLLGVSKYALPPPLLERFFAVPQLLVPLGLSFFMCHAISYLVDVYRRDAVLHKNPVQTALYLLFFPLLIAGPIVRYRDMSAQLVHRQVGMAAFAYGVRRFAIGLGKVWLISNTLAVAASAIFAQPAGDLSAASAWLGVACFSLQIYFDLSGYADMAIGLGRMFGFRISENFRWPYGADTLLEFWRRWNISLVGWFRAYVALPLDGNRDGRPPVFWRLLTLFVLVGLWHGPGWSVLVWGLYHGTVVVLERAGLAATVARLPALLRHAYLLLVVMVGWVFFRTETVREALLFLQAMAGLNAPAAAPALPVTPVLWLALAAGVVGSVPLPGLSRWTVTLDSMTTSALMIVSTSVVFTWRSAARVFNLLTGRGRGGGAPR